MAETCPIFSYTAGERAKRPSHTSQRSAAPAVAAKMVAGAMAATGVTAVVPVGLGKRRWRRWCRSQVGPARAGRREGAVVEARVASMVARSEAVTAVGVALVGGAGIAAVAAVNGGRLGGGGGLDRARGASTVPAERSGSGKGGYSTLLWAHALVSGSIGSYLDGSCQ